MKFEMNLNPEPFKLIKCGIKTIELRLNDDRRKGIKVGDIIEFTNTEDGTEKLLCQVINIHRFNNFEELYKSLPLLECGYTKENVATAEHTDMNKYYSEEQIKNFGVLGIEIKSIIS